MFEIRIAKADKNIDVDFNAFSPEVKRFIVEQGLSKLLNAATAKDTLAAHNNNEEEMRSDAYVNAQKRVASLVAGNTSARKSKSSGSKVSGEIMTEARRQAKIIVKAQIKAAHGRISDYSSKTLTEYANKYIEANPSVVEAAKLAVEAAQNLASKATMDVAAIPIDPSKVKANEDRKAKAKAATAAKNAGKPGPQASTTAKRGKGSTLPQAPKRAPQEVHATVQ
jgi:hypothetical protein